MAEGGHVVRRLLASPLDVLSVLATAEWLEALEPELERRGGELNVYLAPRRELEKIVGFALHQGVMAVGRIPPQPDLVSLVKAAARPRLVVALDGVTNPENVGVIVRTAAGFGAVAVVTGETAASPWLRRAVRNSMGTVFGLSARRVGDLGATLVALQQGCGLRLVAAALGGKAVWDAGLAGDCCVVLGHEGYGLRPEIAAACDEVVTVPMPAGVDSLNVASAAAVVLYEVRRQQRGVGSPAVS
ncbi:MAG TPA: RNA methyltransferase [Thermoanaerobaculaceae bacterium]|nr:RNA methyltransferase [Thermoanaerobaculaceae bacterium]HRS17533.1 RNA methyltransferase [Thermoanaerobaculaceae bacterium]